VISNNTKIAMGVESVLEGIQLSAKKKRCRQNGKSLNDVQ
jgi:hypothetical protein